MRFINKHKVKIGAVLTIAAILTAAWFWGGRYPKAAAADETVISVVVTENPEPTASVSAPTPTVTVTAKPTVVPKPTEAAATPTEAVLEVSPTPTEPPIVQAPDEPDSNIDASSDGVVKGDKNYSERSGMEINPETGKDQYLTDPVPEGKPLPVEPQKAEISGKAYTCILSVRCDSILLNMELLDEEKHELVPDDGVIFAATEVVYYEGESIFNLLQREMKRNKIHMEFVNTPIYNSAYIEGINNLYEFDVGELSGWMYKVNGWFPNYGCSRYQINEGDIIEWVYTCDLGRDVGGYYAAGGE